ncbi:MAG: hypothetical protein ACLSAP_05355 [Oscillospiraceae bacterium]
MPVLYTLNGQSLGTGFVYRCAVAASGSYTLKAVDIRQRADRAVCD